MASIDTMLGLIGKLESPYITVHQERCALVRNRHADCLRCAESCASGCISYDGEVLTVSPEKCIGCGTCVESCPYGAPHLDEEAGHVTKCDMCQALVEAGEQPACVESCPTRALYFGELAELAERFPGTDALIEPLPETDTAPSLFVLPHKDAQRSGAGTGAVIFAVDEV